MNPSASFYLGGKWHSAHWSAAAKAITAGTGRAKPRTSTRNGIARSHRPSQASNPERNKTGPRAAAGHNNNSMLVIAKPLATLGHQPLPATSGEAAPNTARCQRAFTPSEGRIRSDPRITSSKSMTILSQKIFQPRMRA